MSVFHDQIPLVLQESYEEGMREVLAYNHAHEKRISITTPGKEGSLAGFYYGEDTQTSKGTVLMLHGFTENADKFHEIIYAFLQSGYCVAIYDQRGHGRSYRYPGVAGNYLTHIDRFETYVADFEEARKALLQDAPGPYYLFAHSMGGAVAALALEEEGEKTPFTKAVLNSPMIAPATGGFPAWVGSFICHVAILFGKAKKIIFLSKPYSGEEKFEESCASGQARFDWYDGLRQKTPEFHNSSPSYRWTLESLKVTKKILQPGAVEKISIPVLVHQAELDNTVLPGPQEAFVSRLRNGKLVKISNAKHEIYRSEDPELITWWNSMITFMEE